MDSTPPPQRRSARQATYGSSSSKRRRLLGTTRGQTAAQSPDADDSQSSNSTAPEAPASPTSAPKQRTTNRVRFLGRDTTPTSPLPMSQEVAEAFEIASPGSASPAKKPSRNRNTSASPLKPRAAAHLQAPASPSSSSRRGGIAARMQRAQRPMLGADEDDDDEGEEQGSQPQSQASQEAAFASSRQTSPRLRSRQASPSPSTFGQSRSQLAPDSHDGRTRTYGAGVRSHLAAIPIDAAQSSHSASAEPEASTLASDRWAETQDSQQRESYVEMRQKYVIEEAGTDESLNSAGADPALRSLTNLRSAGSLKRFIDELNYTLAGLDSRTASLGARQSSSIEIVQSLCGRAGKSGEDDDGEEAGSGSEGGDDGDDDGATRSDTTTFLYRLKATNTYGKVWTALRSAKAGNGTDELLDWSLLLVLHRLTDPRIMGSSLFDAHGADVWAVLRVILTGATERARSDGEGQDQTAQSGKGKAKKSARSQSTNRAKLHQLSMQSGLVAPDTQEEPSLVLIAVSIIAAVVQIPRSPSFDPRRVILERPLSLQDLGDDTEDSLLAPTLLGAIMRELMRQSDGAGLTLANRQDGNAIPSPASSTPSVDVLAILARIFESLVGSLDEVAQGATFTGLAADDCKQLVANSIVDVVRCLRSRSGSHLPASTDLASLQALATMGDWLKVLTALTQGQETWCKAVSSRSAAIGTLVNLIVELSPTSVGGGTLAYGASRKGKERASTSSATPSDLDADAVRHDALCLAVALLTNLLEHDADTATRLATVQLNDGCKKRGCDVEGSCTCGGPKAQLAVPKLFDLVATGWQQGSLRETKAGTQDEEALAAAADLAHTEILRASIALALGLAIRHHPENATCLEKQRGGAAALETLASILEDLAPLHRDVVQRSMSSSSTGTGQGDGVVGGHGAEEEGGEPDVVGNMAAMLRGMAVERRGGAGGAAEA